MRDTKNRLGHLTQPVNLFYHSVVFVDLDALDVLGADFLVVGEVDHPFQTGLDVQVLGMLQTAVIQNDSVHFITCFEAADLTDHGSQTGKVHLQEGYVHEVHELLSDVQVDVGDVGHTQRNADQGGGDDADEDVALDTLCLQGADDNQTDQSDQCAPQTGGVSFGDTPLGEVHQADQCGCVGDDRTGVLQTDDGDEQTDTGAHGVFDTVGDGGDHGVTDAADCQNQTDKAGDEDNSQCLMIGVTHVQDDRVREECYQTHTGCLDVGDTRVQGIEDGADESAEPVGVGHDPFAVHEKNSTHKSGCCK